MKKLTTILSPAFFVLATLALQAGPISFDNDKGDLNYSQAANWTGDVLPGSADTARIGGGQKVTLNSALTGNTHSCHIGIPGGSGALTINRGGSITFSNYAALGWDHLGTLTINKGGSFSCGPLGIGAYVRSPGKGPGGILNMNGGTLKTGSIQATSDLAILNLSGGSITATGLRFPASEHDGTVINWDFSSGSSTTITVTGNVIELLATEININLAGLKNGKYTLISNKGTGIVDCSGKVNIKGVAPGSGAKINHSGNAPGDDLILTISPRDIRPPHLRQ